MMFSRRLLQIAVLGFGLVPVGAGLDGIIRGAALAGPGPFSASLNSDFSYLSGLLLAIGIGFYSTVPRIELRTGRFRLLTGLVIIGGLGRLYSMITVGVPDGAMVFGQIMELIVTPLLCVWQGIIAAA
jgi:hypothetical protein